jgi:hypothetical protein
MATPQEKQLQREELNFELLSIGLAGVALLFAISRYLSKKKQLKL